MGLKAKKSPETIRALQTPQPPPQHPCRTGPLPWWIMALSTASSSSQVKQMSVFCTLTVNFCPTAVSYFLRLNS
jgi:hypothetical protein